MQIQMSGRLSAEEAVEFERAQASGAASVQLYKGGVFSEPDFVRYGVLQRLEIRRLLVSQGLSRHDGDMSFAFGLADDQARIAA